MPKEASSLDSPIRLERGTDGTVRVPVQDSHGNITKVINGGSGGTLFTASYSPFGERVITLNNGLGGADGMGQPVGFTGAEHDSVSQLVYLRNRYYAPGLGRFISEDPAGFAGSPDGNLFAYCGNDPINFSDPLGLWGVQFGGTLIGSGEADLAFDMQGLADGLDTGLHGAASGITFGLYDGGAYRCMPGFGGSQVLGAVGGAAALMAGGGAILESGAAASAYWWASTRLGMMGSRIAAGAGAAGAAINRLLRRNCFPAGTMIQLADGSVKPIEEITDKDVVWARDDATGETKACRVKRTFHKSADELVVLSFGEVGDPSGKIVETVRCTVEHPFYVDGKGWVGASDLGIGTEIVTRAGPNLVVQKVEREKHPNRIDIYNFEVEGLHSYFVGKVNGGLWVHNQSWKSKPFWGHTFELHGHGQKNTVKLTGRAASTGDPQGQWLDNEAAAKYLLQFQGLQGPSTPLVRLPPGLGQVIMPNGSILPANSCLIIPKPGGYKTAYPIIL